MIVTETMTQLAQNYQAILKDVNLLAADRPIKLITVSKSRTVEDIRELYQLGQRDFAENYVQEFADKATQLKDLPISWHFIGNIQSNKTKLISHQANWVHSLSSVKHALYLNKYRPPYLGQLNVLIEVNISNEANKHGLTELKEIINLAQIINDTPHLKLRGLMGMASANKDTEVIKSQFKRLKQLFDELIQLGYAIDTLSMGMSADYELAINEGATLVRIGSRIFSKENLSGAS